LKKVSGGPRVWPDPQEVLKRTDGNDFIYYGTYGYESSYDLIKNYYVPFNGIYNCDIFTENPLEGIHVQQALDTFDKLVEEAGRVAVAAAYRRPRDFLRKVSARNRETLAGEAKTRIRLSGADEISHLNMPLFYIASMVEGGLVVMLYVTLTTSGISLTTRPAIFCSVS
jgi:hypothetical protein